MCCRLRRACKTKVGGARKYTKAPPSFSRGTIFVTSTPSGSNWGISVLEISTQRAFKALQQLNLLTLGPSAEELVVVARQHVPYIKAEGLRWVHVGHPEHTPRR